MKKAKPRHVGPYLECEECEYDEFAVRMGLDGKLIFECANCGRRTREDDVHKKALDKTS